MTKANSFKGQNNYIDKIVNSISAILLILISITLSNYFFLQDWLDKRKLVMAEKGRVELRHHFDSANNVSTSKDYHIIHDKLIKTNEKIDALKSEINKNRGFIAAQKKYSTRLKDSIEVLRKQESDYITLLKDDGSDSSTNSIFLAVTQCQNVLLEANRKKDSLNRELRRFNCIKLLD